MSRPETDNYRGQHMKYEIGKNMTLDAETVCAQMIVGASNLTKATNFTNATTNKSWWEVLVSNQWPPQCECDALPLS